MMAIRRFRFALLLALFLATSAAFAPEASAYKSVVAQVLPDEGGDYPTHAASGGSTGPEQNGRGATKGAFKSDLLQDGTWIHKDLQPIKMLWFKVIGLVF